MHIEGLHPEELTEAACNQHLQKAPDVVWLGHVLSYNVTLQLKIEKNDSKTRGISGMTTLTLREVPKFLIDAFKIVNAHVDSHGIFRRGANQPRLNKIEKRQTEIFCGTERIPADFTVHDVCGLIKLFFNSLKVPLFCFADTRERLLDYVTKKERGVAITVDDMQELFRPRQCEGSARNQLPEAHIGTIGYLMRQLYNVTRHSEQNGMTAENLAIVFGPTLLGTEYVQKLKSKKSAPGRMQSMGTTPINDADEIHRRMNEAKDFNKRAIDAVQILIESAMWIGLNRECYVSSQARSSSAAPLHRTPLATVQMVPMPATNGEKRPSLKTANELEALRISEAGARLLIARPRRRSFSQDDVNLKRDVDVQEDPTPMKEKLRLKARRSLNFLTNHLSPHPGRRGEMNLNNNEREEDAEVNNNGVRNVPHLVFDVSASGAPAVAADPARAPKARVHGRRSSSVAMKEMFTNLIRRRRSVERVSNGGGSTRPREVVDSQRQKSTQRREREASTGLVPTRSPHQGLNGHQSRSRIRDSPKRAPVYLDIVSPTVSQATLNNGATVSRQGSAAGRTTYSTATKGNSNEAVRRVSSRNPNDKKRVTNRNPTPGPGQQAGGKLSMMPRLMDPEATPDRTPTMYHKELPQKVPAPDFDSPNLNVEQRKYHDPAVSMYVDIGQGIGRPERRRRHTTPVKSGGALRRNHPNALVNGLKPRRNTQTITSEEKENMKRRSHSVEDVESTGDSADDVIDDGSRHNAAALREQMGIESRQRRVKRQRRKESASALMPETASGSFINASTSPMLQRVSPSAFASPPVTVNTADTNARTPMNGSPSHRQVSPLILTTSTLMPSPTISMQPEQISPPRILQVTPTQSPVIHKCSPSGQCTHPTVTITSVVTTTRRESTPTVVEAGTPRVLSIEISPEPREKGERVSSSLSQRSSDADVCMKSDRGSTENLLSDKGSTLFSSPTISSSPSQTPSTTHSMATPSPKVLRAQLSLDSSLTFIGGMQRYSAPLSPRLSRNSAGRVPLSPGGSRPSIAPKPSLPGTPTKTMMAPPLLDSPMGRKGVSSSGLERRPTTSPVKGLPRQVSADEFNNSEQVKAAIFTAQSSSELDMISGRSNNHLEQRPSVAFIAHQRRGLVRDRVNMFGQMTVPLDSVSAGGSGRSSAMSSRASSELDDFEFVKPAAPPASHTFAIPQRRPSHPVLTRYASTTDNKM